MAGLFRRGKTYYAAGEERRVILWTTSLQIAKDKVRKIESALVRQEDLPLATRHREEEPEPPLQGRASYAGLTGIWIAPDSA